MIKKLSIFMLIAISIAFMAAHSTVFGAKFIKTNNETTMEQNKGDIQKVAPLKKKPKKTIASISTSININKATEQELISIKGIGAKKAKAIIDHRDNNGKFKSIEQLKEVKGISDKLFNKIVSSITI